MASYTSNTEFDLVKRVQITNEVPPISLWHHLPSGLRNDFWKYIVGTVEVDHNVDVIGPEHHHQKIVNGVPAPVYGPAIPVTPEYENPEQFHNLIIDGVITPEFDFLLHELYRYLDTVYPDHPDYDQLLTPLEINEMFRAAAAILGYVPNYTFLENWSRSIGSLPMPSEEMKWKIRDLRSLAFRRKFSGSYQGYKMLFSSIYRHGSVYITGTYQPQHQGSIDYTDARTFRKFRLIDYFGVNDSVYREVARVDFRGIITPNETAKVYHHTTQSVLALSNNPFSRIAIGAFLQRRTDSLNLSNVTIQSIESQVVASSQQLNSLLLSAPQEPTLRTYEVQTIDQPEASTHTLQLTPNPRVPGSFLLPLSEAFNLYPSITPIVDTIEATELLDHKFTPGVHALRDEYIEEIFTHEDHAAIQHVIRGQMSFTLEPERSPVLLTAPSANDPRFGIEIPIRQYESLPTGQITSYVVSTFIQTTLSFTTDASGRPIRAEGAIISIPEFNPLTSLLDPEAETDLPNRQYLLNEDGRAAISIGAPVRFVTYSAELGRWRYMYGYEGWIDAFDWGQIHVQESVRKGEVVSPNAPFTFATFEAWKTRAAVPFITDTAVVDEISINGEVYSTTPNRVLITNTYEARKLENLSPGDQVRGPGIPTGTVITAITSDYFDISNNALRFGFAEFFVLLRSTRNVTEPSLSDFKTQLHTLYPAMSSSLFTAMWPSHHWPQVSQAYLEGLKDASLFQPLAVERVTNNPARITFDNTIFLELSLDRVLRHPNTAGFRMGASYASLMDISWLEYLESFLATARRATENIHIGTQLTLTTDQSGLYSIIPGNQYSDPSISARFITIPFTYSQDSTPAYLQLGTGGHTAERTSLFTSVSDLLRPPLYGVASYETNRDMSNDPESVTLQKRSVYTVPAQEISIYGFASATNSNQLVALSAASAVRYGQLNPESRHHYTTSLLALSSGTDISGKDIPSGTQTTSAAIQQLAQQPPQPTPLRGMLKLGKSNRTHPTRIYFEEGEQSAGFLGTVQRGDTITGLGLPQGTFIIHKAPEYLELDRARREEFETTLEITKASNNTTITVIGTFSMANPNRISIPESAVAIGDAVAGTAISANTQIGAIQPAGNSRLWLELNKQVRIESEEFEVLVADFAIYERGKYRKEEHEHYVISLSQSLPATLKQDQGGIRVFVAAQEVDSVASSNDHLDSPLFEVPLGEHEYAIDVASTDRPGNRHQIVQASVYLEDFRDIPLNSELVVNSPYITKGEQLPRDLYRFRGRWNPTPSEDNRDEPIWPRADENDPFTDRDYFLISSTTSVGAYEYNNGDWLLFIDGAWVRRQWLLLGEWTPTAENEYQEGIYRSPSKVELQGHLAPLGLSIRDALDKYFVYFIASDDFALLDRVDEATGTASIIPVRRHDWIILTRETYVDDVVNNLNVRLIPQGDKYLLVSPPEGGREVGEWNPVANPTNPSEPLWPTVADTYPTVSISEFEDLDYFKITSTEPVTIGTYTFTPSYYVRVYVTEAVEETELTPGSPREETWDVLPYSYISWTEYQPWLVAGGKTYEIIQQSFDRSILGAASFNAITSQRAELIDSTLQTLDLPRRFLSRGSCNFQLKIDPQFYAQDTNGVRFSLTEGPIYWDNAANRFYVNNRNADGSTTAHYIRFQEPIYFKNLLSLVGTVFADTPNEVHVYPGHEFDPTVLSLTDRVESGNYVYVRNPYERALENQYYSHYVPLYGVFDPTDPYKVTPVSESPTAEERQEEFRLSLLSIAPKVVGGVTQQSKIRAILPAILRTYEPRFENKFFRNLLMLGGVVKRDSSNVIFPVSNDVDSLQVFADAMAELNSGDYIQAVYLTTGTTYRFAQDVFAESNQTTNVIAHGSGTWLAAGTNGALSALYEEDGDQTWTPCTLPQEWDPIIPINAALFSTLTNTWWIFGSQSKIARSLDDAATWGMYTEPDEWEGLNLNITCALASNPFGEDSNPNLFVIGTDNGQLAYLDETDVNPLWLPLQLPVEGSLSEDDEDDDEEPGDGDPGDGDDEPEIDPPSLVGWGDTPVLALGYNAATDTWMVGGAEGKLATTSTLLDPVRDPEDTESTLPLSQWVYRSLPDEWISATINSITCIDSTWLIGGDLQGQGMLAYSTDDGLTWKISRFIDTDDNEIEAGTIYRVGWKPGEWLATSDEGVVYTSAIDNNFLEDGEHELDRWTIKPVPNLPPIPLTAFGVAADTVLLGGTNPNIYTISNTTRPGDAIQIRHVNRDEGIFNIVTDGPIVGDDDWEEDNEIRVLCAIYTLRSVSDSLIGIPPTQLSSFVNPRTRQLYLPTHEPVDSPDIANRVYLPRMNSFLLESLLVSQDPNPEYIGANGYPLYEENSSQYSVRADGTPRIWTNDALLPLHYCDESGDYIDTRGVPLSAHTFVEQIAVENEDEESESETRIDRADPRTAAYQPIYTTYLDWLQDGNDIEEGDTPLDIDLSQAVVDTIYNEQHEEPYIKISITVSENAIRVPYNGVSLSILPVEPVPIPLVGVPRYRTDQSGANMGIVAHTTGDQVFYSIEPLSNNVSLLATRGPNIGFSADDVSEDEREAIYSLEPVQGVPQAFVTEDGSLIAIKREVDGEELTYYTLDNPHVTGLYFHPFGYGSWADRPTTNTQLPWENDPNAFMGFDLNEDGLVDSFVYLQNTRQDIIYLVDGMGRLIYDEANQPIPVPAPKYLTYAGLVAGDGAFAEKEQLSLDNRSFTVTGVAQNNRSFELSRSIPLEAGAFARQVRLNILTLASIATTDQTKTDTRLIHQLSIQDMARYEPDRVYYADSAYPSRSENPELYETGSFTNRNGAPVYACNQDGYYVSSLETYATTQDLNRRIQPPQPLFYLCQDWFDNDYFIRGHEDNPYWQYIVFEDYLDHRSKEWRQRVRTYRKVKGDLGQEMVLRPIDSDRAYVSIYPGLEYVQDAASMIVRQTDYIQYRLGRINCVMVANSRYDKKVNPNIDAENAEYGLNYQSVFDEAEDLNGDPVDMFNGDEVVQTRLRGEWQLNYTINTTKNFANPQDTRSSIVAITELGLYNRNGQMIAYGTFPPVIYDSAKHHMSVNLLIKQGEFAPLGD